MWRVWTKATTFHKLPCEVFDEDHEYDSLTRYLGDNAVTWFGITMENALKEEVPVGDPKKGRTRPKYTLEELLEDDFKLPRPPTKLEKRQQGAMNLLQLAQDPKSGVKLWRELRPEEKQANGTNGV